MSLETFLDEASDIRAIDVRISLVLVLGHDPRHYPSGGMMAKNEKSVPPPVEVQASEVQEKHERERRADLATLDPWQ